MINCWNVWLFHQLELTLQQIGQSMLNVRHKLNYTFILQYLFDHKISYWFCLIYFDLIILEKIPFSQKKRDNKCIQVTYPIQFFLNEFHWIQQIQWIMTKSKSGIITKGITYLLTDTLYIVMIHWICWIQRTSFRENSIVKYIRCHHGSFDCDFLKTGISLEWKSYNGLWFKLNWWELRLQKLILEQRRSSEDSSKW